MLCLVYLVGCNIPKLTDIEINKKLFELISNEAIGRENIVILCKKSFKNKNIVLFSYDLADVNHIDYNYYEINGRNIRLLGGSSNFNIENRIVTHGI
ncbi:hypothetical protein [Thermoanaerobacterium sp. RBIITD]|uniref:hypothetical protein n=1 Tax=Thermoanaerobacterium sp. RBIITD TaxID=1550240 RepID=UPI000BB77A7E|nr:hypothetical protein [Thermoanaerobacterium sp. RBIITD]